MGYRSNVRFKLLKSDYEELVKKFEEKRQGIKEQIKKLKLLKDSATLEEEKEEIQQQIYKIDNMSDLFCKDEDNWGDLIKKDRTEKIYFHTDDEQDRWNEKEVEVVYFGWDGLKWYDGYADVDFVMDFVRSRENYAYCRTGEETQDIEEECEGLDGICVYTAFEEDCE